MMLLIIDEETDFHKNEHANVYKLY